MFDLRPKTRPLPELVNLCEGEDKEIEVNSGFPLMDIIPNICQQIGKLLDIHAVARFCCKILHNLLLGRPILRSDNCLLHNHVIK